MKPTYQWFLVIFSFQEMKQQFELSERLEREKKNLEDLNELEMKKMSEEFQQTRSAQFAEQKKLVTLVWWINTSREYFSNLYELYMTLSGNYCTTMRSIYRK